MVPSRTDLHVEDTGGPGPTVLFSHGLLWDTRLFAPQIDALRERYRCIAWDHRGQGRSPVTADGYDMDTLAADAVALIERLGVAPVHYVGLSMGGFVGLRLAIHRPELLRSLTLIDTSAEPEPAANLPRYRMLNLIARVFGIGLVVDRVMPILFGPSFLTDPARAAERAEYRRRLAGNHRIGIARAVADVIGRSGVADQLHRIRTPTLVLVGAEDTATPPDKAAALQRGIADARLIVVPAAGHTSTLENPAFVTAAIAQFLTDQEQQALPNRHPIRPR